MSKKENFTPRQRAPQVGRNIPGKMNVDFFNKAKKNFTPLKGKKNGDHHK